MIDYQVNYTGVERAEVGMIHYLNKIVSICHVSKNTKTLFLNDSIVCHFLVIPEVI